MSPSLSQSLSLPLYHCFTACWGLCTQSRVNILSRSPGKLSEDSDSLEMPKLTSKCSLSRLWNAAITVLPDKEMAWANSWGDYSRKSVPWLSLCPFHLSFLSSTFMESECIALPAPERQSGSSSPAKENLLILKRFLCSYCTRTFFHHAAYLGEGQQWQGDRWRLSV